MSEKKKTILVVGGGIAGLTAAFYAQMRFKERGSQVNIVLVEREKTLGGKIRTLERDGFVIERGPDSILTRKWPAVQLAMDLGLTDQLQGLNPDGSKTYILQGGRLHRMPSGLTLGIPTEIMPLMRTKLLSLKGKLRAGLDLVLPSKADGRDESLGGFLERRLGREVVERLAEPLLAGIYAGDTRVLSIQSTFPQFQRMEQQFGSLIRGLILSKKQQPSGKKGENPLPAHLRKSGFLSFKRGLYSLVRGLSVHLQGQDIRTGQSVSLLRKTASGYEADLDSGETLSADGVIMALPAPLAAKLLPDAAGKYLGDVPYVSVANVVLAYRAEQIRSDFDGSGFLVPRSEGRFITACTWTSNKWLHTAPQGHVLLRCYVGHAKDGRWQALDDETLVERVRLEVKEIIGIDAEPLFAEVSRWQDAMPQYLVGHGERIAAARAGLREEMPEVYLVGAGYDGVGIPDCIRPAREAAEELADQLLSS